MEKKSIIIISIVILLVLGILIWGWVGANYHSAIPEDRTVCDFGLMEELDVGTPNVYLCWLWHTSSIFSNQQIQTDIGKLYGNSS